MIVGMMLTRVGRHPAVFAAALAIGLAACSGDTVTEPTMNASAVTGSFMLRSLAFDPQGVLPEIDVAARLGATPELILVGGGSAQIVFRDPATGLFSTLAGTYRMTPTGVQIDFDGRARVEDLLLPRRLVLTFGGFPAQLFFDGESPGGVSRERLRVLVPEWNNEQLLSPTPGRLRVMFGR